MKKNTEHNKEPDGMEELKKFYAKKKKEQEALKKLLKALDKKSLNEDN